MVPYEAAHEDVEPLVDRGKIPASKKRISHPETLETIMKLVDIRKVICITGVRRYGKLT
ncbi:hypothetical protein [Methanosarcina sp.]|uniref:hypothetical protein n=1 Tax=Methanosarcina sp. TaxID=2213 RepID=UPI002ABBB8FA|nr:hypothetical protein [Methanosarcina sp.]MDY9927801.1 hypothetical protein [Methanosarcina sp.]